MVVFILIVIFVSIKRESLNDSEYALARRLADSLLHRRAACPIINLSLILIRLEAAATRVAASIKAAGLLYPNRAS